MDGYPALSLDLSVPLLVTLGIPSEKPYDAELEPGWKNEAIEVRSELPPVELEQARALLRYIQDRDASRLPWHGRDTEAGHRFRIKSAERTVLLPPRQAKLPENMEAPETPPVLHSPFSPLSPSCPLYPDGLMDATWIKKHHDMIPSVLVCFYNVTLDPTLATLDDNKIKADVNKLRSLLSQSRYRTRLAVVLFSEKAPSFVEGIQERLENIRKGCGVDSKALFLVPPKDSPEELGRSADTILTALYGVALEYYRDASRHARKKRGRAVIPQPTLPPTSGTSQTLSLAGWNVRYDFKSAVFAEYRQEMDSALRSYEQAYESLLGPELLEAIPSWSPRWNEARLLADIMAVRCIRCLLWNELPSLAVRRWQAHRDRIQTLVDRHGRGTNNYGWAAWEARWAQVMAELIERADIPNFEVSTTTLFLQPEKTLIGERLRPWELLHHPGYWYHLAARHQATRRMLAQAMPEEDRRSPSDSPASRVASKAFTYDTYMCPDPHDEYPLTSTGTDHSHIIADLLTRSRAEFLERDQLRSAAEISLECAKELIMCQKWDAAVETLQPLWSSTSFQAEGWIDIAEELCWTLRRAAVMAAKGDVVVAIDWALLNRTFTRRPDWHYDITRSLDGVSCDPKPTVQSKDDGPVSSWIAPSFIFRTEQGEAGQAARAQLSITSHAHEGSAPIVLDSIRVQFEGSIKPVVLKHDPSVGAQEQSSATTAVTAVSLEETVAPNASTDDDRENLPGDRILVGTANLTLRPGRVLAFHLNVPLREPGEANATTLVMSVQTDTFGLEHTATFSVPRSPSIWYHSATRRKHVSRANPLWLRILPRPPKMEVKSVGLLDQYYTSEPLDLHFEIANAEEADAVVRFEAMLFGESPPDFALEAGNERSQEYTLGEDTKTTSVSLGTVQTSQTTTVAAHIGAIKSASRYELTVTASYHLSTDPATLITRAATFQLNIVNPFEANYDLLPRLHSDPWPSLFDPDTVVAPTSEENEAPPAPMGLSQTWCLVTRYASFAKEPLRVVDLDLLIHASPSVRANATKLAALPATGLEVNPKTIEEASFDIVAQRASLDDRLPTSLEVFFLIKWTRLDASADAAPNITTLPVPRMNIFGIEPRVLVAASYTAGADGGPKLLVLDVDIENASNHFLTFGLTMEPSDDFAFSGPKQTTLHLLPVSRRAVTYRLLPRARGVWLRPGLVVRDKYFQKVLRVIPTEGMKADKDGVLLWVPPDDEEEAAGLQVSQ